MKKTFVLDTNVLLHDHDCLDNFQENDIVIPIVALEELDRFKKGNETINYNAREFARKLDEICGDALFNGGVSLGPGRGKLRVVTGKPFSEEMKLSFGERIADHRILAIADAVRREVKDGPVILVSKDINLRLKAKSLGIMAQDYLSDKVEDLGPISQAATLIEGVADELIAQLYRVGEGIDQISLISLTGKAGTGKTLLALAAALAQEETYDTIMLARPIIPLSNRDIGFLPGDINSKIGPYMQPLFDNLAVIKSSLKSTSRSYTRIEEMQRDGQLVISPLAYIRGRSLSNVFVIVDEAQNLTPHEVKTIITRAGEGTRMVFTGDIYQIDHPYLDTRSNGLTYLADRMYGQEMFARATLTKGERSPLAELASDLL